MSNIDDVIRDWESSPDSARWRPDDPNEAPPSGEIDPDYEIFLDFVGNIRQALSDRGFTPRGAESMTEFLVSDLMKRS